MAWLYMQGLHRVPICLIIEIFSLNMTNITWHELTVFLQIYVLRDLKLFKEMYFIISIE